VGNHLQPTSEILPTDNVIELPTSYLTSVNEESLFIGVEGAEIEMPFLSKETLWQTLRQTFDITPYDIMMGIKDVCHFVWMMIFGVDERDGPFNTDL